MHPTTRLVFIALFATGMTGGAWAMEDVPHSDIKGATEYRRADTNFYGKGDVVRAHPGAVIIPQSGYTKTGDSYFFTPKIKAPKEMYAETLTDWIEPITPPDMPASLGVPPDAMQIREPQGDVQVALPSAPANFAPVTDGMSLPNGAVLKTGANGTAAVLFGGVDSARLIPNSEAAVQQTVAAQSRTVEVDLTAGGVFSKVGSQVGVKGEYEVHTPFGNAVAHGTDFATIVTSTRTDVWIAQGTVQLNPPDGRKGPVVTSDGLGPLKIMRLPAIADPHASFAADTETLTTVLNFIPLANQKIKALRDKASSGATLSTNEQAYLARIKKVPCVIKLALVELPAPPPAPTPAPTPIAASPATATPATPAVASPPSTPQQIVPVHIDLQTDGSVSVDGAPMGLADLKLRLDDIAKAIPNQPILISGREKVTHAQLQKVIALCHEAKLKVKVAKALPKPATPVAATPAPTPAPVIAPLVSAPTLAPTPAPATPVANPASPTTPPAPAKPITVRIRTDGKVNFQKTTFDLAGLKSKLTKIAKTTPDQSFVIRAGKKVADAQIQLVLGAFHNAGLQNITIVAPPAATPTTTTAPAEQPAQNLPTPGLLMHPTMAPTSGNPAPSEPPVNPYAPVATPSTNPPASATP